jgi:hypothetical protein
LPDICSTLPKAFHIGDTCGKRFMDLTFIFDSGLDSITATTAAEMTAISSSLDKSLSELFIDCSLKLLLTQKLFVSLDEDFLPKKLNSLNADIAAERIINATKTTTMPTNIKFVARDKFSILASPQHN